jgi:hypothetical protein
LHKKIRKWQGTVDCMRNTASMKHEEIHPYSKSPLFSHLDYLVSPGWQGVTTFSSGLITPSLGDMLIIAYIGFSSQFIGQ